MYSVSLVYHITHVGMCGSLSVPNCEDKSTLRIVNESCYGLETCSITIDPQRFNASCADDTASFAYEVICSENFRANSTNVRSMRVYIFCNSMYSST